MVKVCQVSSVHSTFDTRIFYKICHSLSSVYDVYYISANAKTEDVNGIHIIGVPVPERRLLRYMCIHRFFRQCLAIDAQVYQFHDPELIPVGLKLKKKGKKVIFDSHEDVPQQILWKEYLPGFLKKTISSLYEWYERKALKQYDALISVTPSIVNRLSAINSNVRMITNYPVFRDTCTSWGNGAICFAGGVSRQYMHRNIIDSLVATKAKYLLAGPAYPGYLSTLQTSPGWSQVEYLGVLKQEQVYELYSRSVAGVVLLGYSPNVGYKKGTLGVLKMFEYMMAGLPVIATDFDLWKEIIEENECGKCINPYDVSSISDAINYYLDNPEVARRHGENGRRLVKEKYNWGTQEAILFNLYSELV